MRLIAVVMGTDSDEARMRESQKLLSYGFRYFETQSLYQAQIPLKDQPVFYGEPERVSRRRRRCGIDCDGGITKI